MLSKTKFAAILTAAIALSGVTFAKGLLMRDIVYSEVTFRLPAHWKTEDEPEALGVFYEDRADSGTLRLSVIEASGADTGHVDELISVATQGTKALRLHEGISLHTEVRSGKEDGHELEHYRWLVSVRLSATEFRLLIFTHTILKGQKESDPRSAAEIAMIDRSVREATYTRTPQPHPKN